MAGVKPVPWLPRLLAQKSGEEDTFDGNAVDLVLVSEPAQHVARGPSRPLEPALYLDKEPKDMSSGNGSCGEGIVFDMGATTGGERVQATEGGPLQVSVYRQGQLVRVSIQTSS